MSSEIPEPNDNDFAPPELDPPTTAELAFQKHDDAEPRWLHWSSLLFGVLSQAKQLIIPLFFAGFSAAKGSVYGLWVAAVFFLMALVITTFKYLTLRYQIKGGDLIVKEGLIFRRVRTVPIRRIQNMDLVQNIVHRLFRVAEVKVETASGTEPEATLRVLTMSQIQELRDRVFKGPERQPTAIKSSVVTEKSETSESALANSGLHDEGLVLLRIPTSWLIKAGFASNRGGLIFGVLFGFMFQFDLEDQVNWKEIRNYIPEIDGSLQSFLLTFAAILAVLLVLRVFGTIWYILRFHDYELKRVGEDLRIRCGLFTKVSATVPRKRIQFISIHRSLLLRWMGMSVIRIETAGGAGKGNEDAAASVSRRWFIPVVEHSRVEGLLRELRPGLDWEPEQAKWVGLAKRAPARLSRLAVIVCILASVAGYFAFGLWGLAVGGCLLPFAIGFAIKKSRSMKYARTAFGVVYRSGILTKKMSMTFFERIQTLRVNQSPFDRRWKMAKLIVDTAAAGPAEHTINVRFLDEQFAFQEFNELTETSARNQPNWNP
jgi:putative membrane protein